MTDAQRAAYEQLALKNCDRNPRPPEGSAYLVTAYRLRLQPARLDGNLNNLWSQITSNGLAELPPSIQRDWIMMDGHTFVVEFRTAGEYRASVIECTKPEVPADTQVQRIGTLLFNRLPAASWLQCVP
jgi:hypothetical protein